MNKPDNSIKLKPRTVRGRIVHSTAAAVSGLDRSARRTADQARYTKHRIEVQPEETKPEGDAAYTVEETAEQFAEAVPRTVYRLTRAQMNHIRQNAARKKEAAEIVAEQAEKSASGSGIEDQPRQSPSRRAQNDSINHTNVSSGTQARASPDIGSELKDVPSFEEPIPSDPGNRSLSARELEKARANKQIKSAEIDLPENNGTIPSERKSPIPRNQTNANAVKGNDALDSNILPRVRQNQQTIIHEKPAPSMPVSHKSIRQPVKASRIIESTTQPTIRTADAAARTTARQASAASARISTKATQMARETTAKNAAKVAKHMAELSRRAAIRTANALRRAAQAALRAAAAAGKALMAAVMSGGWIAVVVVLVLLMCASILASPFGIFTHTDATEFPESITLSTAITTINAEYVAEIDRLRGNADNVSVLIEGNLEGGMEPANWVDVLAVFSVDVTMRDDGAMDVVQLDQAKMDELRRIFWDMNKLTVSRDTEDGITTVYIEGRSLSYTDMYVPYAFTDQQKQLIKDLMSSEHYAFWSNFVKVSTGYDPDDWTGVVDDDYVPGMNGSAMSIPKIYQFDYKKTVCKIDGKNKSASTSGCGATSMCMVIHYLTGNTKPTPYTLFKWAYDNGYYTGDGLSHGAVSAIGKICGVTGTWIGKKGDRIIKALTSGHPVIAHMGPGIFTDYGHYIVLRGVTEDGLILLNDPNSKSRSKKAYPLSTILKQAKTSTPFMICSKKTD